mmetsp:Transcript_81948/g.206171  ORF Transcript_81948/g.206171 Transcript_81948/m.206171 type:complete len:324 (-) Transcript_81948:877-1848(-)
MAHKEPVTIPCAGCSGVAQHVEDRTDFLSERIVTSAEAALADGLHDLLEARVDGVVTLLGPLQDPWQLLLSRTEDEVHVLTPCLLTNFHVGAVHGANNEATIHHELHVRGATRLGARRRNVLGGVRGRNDLLRRGYAIVRQERELQVGAHIGVVVDNISNIVDELDDRLGAVIARSCLAADAGEALLHLRAVPWRHALDLQVPVDLVETIHELALVLVNALHLHIDQRIRVHLQVAMRLHPLRHLLLRCLLHGHPLLLKGLVVLELADATDQRKVLQPSITAQLLRDEFREPRVCAMDPPTRRHAIGAVHELVRLAGGNGPLV